VSGKIRRAEVYRAWADIEDLANGYETMNANFEKHRGVTSNAFQELVKLVEKVKAECVQIANAATGNTVAPWA
jgi:lipopolysaccharide export LptBFGC system permease protein LptF